MKSAVTYRILISVALLGIIAVLFLVNLTPMHDSLLSNLLLVLLGANFMLSRYEKRLQNNQPVQFMSLLKDVVFVLSYLLFWLGVALIIYTFFRYA